MNKNLEVFLVQIPNLEDHKPAGLIDYFAYFLIVFEKREEVNSRDIEKCFADTRRAKYSNIPTYLSKNARSKKGNKAKFIKIKNGYILERHFQLELQKTLLSEPAKIETTILLRDLLIKINNDKERDFLQEAIDCYEIGARRAAITLVWILTIYHLCEFIHKRELADFNTALGKNTDKRIKISAITKFDDFSEIPENKLIEFARSANIITNDVRKILESKLGTRNTSAHPSSVKISEVKATDFISDLVENVILKYTV